MLSALTGQNGDQAAPQPHGSAIEESLSTCIFQKCMRGRIGQAVACCAMTSNNRLISQPKFAVSRKNVEQAFGRDKKLQPANVHNMRFWLEG